ncbi:hypothetical protein [Actinophytocola sp.]|uniref:hypothetical protein n=1 Tax=Actinophytocola sp. TaxID=1872138 RepID=UPI002ED2A0F2
MTYWIRDAHRARLVGWHDCAPVAHPSWPVAWHDHCFPVPLPAVWQLIGGGAYDSAQAFVEAKFGGAEKMARLATQPFYAARIDAAQLTADDPMTPPGYVWDWGMDDVICAACGKPA